MKIQLILCISGLMFMRCTLPSFDSNTSNDINNNNIVIVKYDENQQKYTNDQVAHYFNTIYANPNTAILMDQIHIALNKIHEFHYANTVLIEENKNLVLHCQRSDETCKNLYQMVELYKNTLQEYKTKNDHLDKENKDLIRQNAVLKNNNKKRKMEQIVKKSKLGNNTRKRFLPDTSNS